MFHVLVFLKCDQRALAFFLEARQHAQPDFVLAGEFDRADLQHLRAEARHFEHFLEGDGLEPARLGHDARIGRINAVDVGVNLALVGLQRRGQRDAGGIRSAAPESRDIACLVHPLKAGDDDDAVFGEIGTHAPFVDADDARLGVRAVGHDLDLGRRCSCGP